MDTLELLFNSILETAKEKKKNIDFDGLEFWQPIKTLLLEYDNYKSEKGWKRPISTSITEKILNLPEYVINGKGEKITLEKEHFLIQQVRIPITEELSIRKVLQVAYNIGQYRGMKSSELDDLLLGDIQIKADLKIIDFMYKSDIIRLSKYISSEQLIKLNERLI